MAITSVFTNAGKAITTNRLKGAGTEPRHIAWGTGVGTAAATDTTLFTEATEARVAGVSTQQTTTTTNDTYQVVGALVVEGATKTITNVGLFDAATGGNLFVKSSFTGIELGVGESIEFTQKLVFA